MRLSRTLLLAQNNQGVLSEFKRLMPAIIHYIRGYAMSFLNSFIACRFFSFES